MQTITISVPDEALNEVLAASARWKDVKIIRRSTEEALAEPSAEALQAEVERYLSGVSEAESRALLEDWEQTRPQWKNKRLGLLERASSRTCISYGG